jgi:parvulin-like peptidyl-prolyl isomerase
MKRTALFLFASLFAIGVSASPTEEPIVLAHVGGEPVDSDRLAASFSERHSGHTMFLLGTAEIRRFLDQVIDERLLVQEAYRLGLDSDPEIVATLDEFRSREGAEALIQEEVDARVSVSDEDVRAVWEKELGVVRDLLEIVVATESDAQAVEQRLADGEDFETTARELSIARSRIRGGRVPPAVWGERDVAWEQAAFALEPGQTSAPFRADEGWTIVRLLDRREIERPEIEKVQDRIEALLRKRRLEERRAAFRAELWSKYRARLVEGVDLAPQALKALLESAPDTPFATWEGGSLPVSAFVGEQELGQVAGRGDAEALLGRFLDQTVTGALAALEARARGLDRSPAIESRIVEVREILMLGKLYNDHLLKGLEVTDAEVRAWYDEHRDDFRVPERRRTSQIVVASREEAEAVRARVAAGEDFAALARGLSRDTTSGKAGGDLGWVAVDEIREEMAGVRDLALGAVSEPIETRYGWHLIRVTEIEPSRPREFEEVATGLRERLFEMKKTERRKHWVAQLREATEIVVHDDAIEELARRAEASASSPPGE